MTFEDFAKAHGLIIHHLDYGRWVRCATEDKPRNKNGTYKHLGDVAFLQNHALMSEPVTWFPDKNSDIKIDRQAIKKRQANADREMQENRLRAAKKAGWIINQCVQEQHAYLDSKGWPDKKGLVWRSESNLLVIPMRIGRDLVGVQMIDTDGNKKFLFGQQCKNAEYSLDKKGIDYFCEGYATGLALKAALSAISEPYTVHCCFSAHNMQAMAKAAGGRVVCDNDASGVGEKAAIATGLPYYMPPMVGHDFNDEWQECGLFKTSQKIKKWIMGLHR